MSDILAEMQNFWCQLFWLLGLRTASFSDTMLLVMDRDLECYEYFQVIYRHSSDLDQA